MNKSSPSSLKDVQFEENWNLHPAIEWLFAYKNIFIGAFIALIISLLAASWFLSWRTLNSEKDFFQAETLFAQFQQMNKEEMIASADFEQLQALMQRHPELKAKYQGQMAQILLINGQILQAQVLIQDIFKRTQPDHLQLYQDYTRTSLVMGQEHYGAALPRTEQLRSTLDSLSEKGNPILYAFNLIRLAFLYEQIGQPQEELKVWEELQSKPEVLEALLVANQALNIGQASLSQYIEERKKSLSP